MTCPVCGQRKAKRACPALGQQICAICCGTKRLVEIRCPETCGYLTSAREHPPAAVQRQQQQDVGWLVTTMRELSDPQRELVLVMLGITRSQASDPLQSLRDEDVAGAAATLAATLETAAKGVIYEHQAPSLPAQRLVGDLRAVLQEIGTKVGEKQVERDAVQSLRAIERGARETNRQLGGGPTAYLDLVGRVLRAPVQASTAPESPIIAPEAGASGLILPPD
jgi:hypothetical protein